MYFIQKTFYVSQFNSAHSSGTPTIFHHLFFLILVETVTAIGRHELIPIEIWDKLKALANQSNSSVSKEAEEDSTSSSTCSENIAQTFSNSSSEGNSHVLMTEGKASNICSSATNRVLLDVCRQHFYPILTPKIITL